MYNYKNLKMEVERFVSNRNQRIAAVLAGLAFTDFSHESAFSLHDKDDIHQ